MSQPAFTTPILRLTLIILAGVAILITAWRWRERSGTTGTNHAAVGTPLPEITLQPLTGKGGTLSTADLKQRVALLNFWGTWCPPCRTEFPHLAAIDKEFRDRPDFLYVSVSCGGSLGPEDQADLTAETEEFLSDQQVTHPTWWDPIGQARAALARAELFTGYPTTIIVDQQGVIRGVWQGYHQGDEVRQRELIKNLLAKQSPTAA
ncbi:MAG: TlpA disulfide reductase family protein [Pirellulales bacterium]|nr:TlpA disulfide reductase family protein [Pirellulales bacterium]